MRELGDLSLEQLGNIEVTSVSKHAERLLDAPASIFVISADDIRRSGATTVPEALRLAPNLEVARVNARSYAISARGFNNSIGNKMLVLIDGRTVYTPTFSGVFWDQQDVMLEDVERIEVISGPGAALWGANAFSGVVNIITKPASATQGGLASADKGTTESDLSVRYGTKLDNGGAIRGYVKTSGFHNTNLESSLRVADGWQRQQAGFRGDWGSAGEGFTLQGDTYGGAADMIPQGIPRFSGTNLLGRWNHRLEGGSSVRLQAYYDRTQRDDRTSFNDRTDTYDVEFQHDLPLSERQRLLWGAGHRISRDHTIVTPLVAFIPADKTLRWTNLFAQDEIRLGDKLHLTLGGKLESNVYTGWEFLPSARLAWDVDAKSMAWTALSRTVRAPARLDREFFFPGAPIVFGGKRTFLILGGPNFVSEVADVAEIGYRAQPTSALSYSVTGFYNLYDKLRSGQPAPAMVQNMMDGRAYGIETWGSYQLTRNWKLSAGLTTLYQHIHVEPGSTDPTGPSALGNDPGTQWSIRSSHNLGESQELDISLRHVAALPNPVVPGYDALDLRWGWRIDRHFELSLTLQNALDPGHVEVGPVATGSDVARSVFLKLVWRQ